MDIYNIYNGVSNIYTQLQKDPCDITDDDITTMLDPFCSFGNDILNYSNCQIGGSTNNLKNKLSTMEKGLEKTNDNEEEELPESDQAKGSDAFSGTKSTLYTISKIFIVLILIGGLFIWPFAVITYYTFLRLYRAYKHLGQPM